MPSRISKASDSLSALPSRRISWLYAHTLRTPGGGGGGAEPEAADAEAVAAAGANSPCRSALSIVLLTWFADGGEERRAKKGGAGADGLGRVAVFEGESTAAAQGCLKVLHAADSPRMRGCR